MISKADLERQLERALTAARWIMAPIYLGLSVALGLLALIFIRDLIQYAPVALTGSSEVSILTILTLIDLALTGNLLLLVIYSGYEGFVARLHFELGGDRPSWMDSVDFSSVKLNILASIVGISAIYLLRWFMEVGEEALEPLDEVRLRWLVIIHLTFVVSGVLLALMDRLAGQAKTKL